MSSTPMAPLTIAIVGAGRVGSAYAFQLARAGHELTVVARPDSRRLAQLQGDQGIVLTTDERASVTVADRLDEQAPLDLIIVTTLAHQVGELLPVLRASHAKCVHFMFVTPEAEQLRAAVGAHRATFGLAAILATLDHNGKLNMTITQVKAKQGDERWVDLFSAAGLPSVLQPEMGRWLRSETPLTIAVEGVATAGMRHKGGATWADAQAGAKALRGGYAIIRDLGDTPYPRLKDQMSRTPEPVLAATLWGMSRSRLRETVGNSADECRGLIDLLAAEARQKPELRAAVEALLAVRPDNAAALTERAGPSWPGSLPRQAALRREPRPEPGTPNRAGTRDPRPRRRIPGERYLSVVRAMPALGSRPPLGVIYTFCSLEGLLIPRSGDYRVRFALVCGPRTR